MSKRTDLLTQQLWNKSSLDDCSETEIEALAHQYPYFSTVQLLLLQKRGSAVEDGAYQKAALHCPNPLLVQHWLIHQEEETATQLFENPIPVTENAEAEIEHFTEQKEEALITDSPLAVEAPKFEIASTDTELGIPSVEEAEPEGEETNLLPAEEQLPLEPEQLFENPMPAAAPEVVKEVVPEPATEVPEVAAVAATIQDQPIEPITFEPFYTVDYFASQGIKLSVPEGSNDSLNRQMRSFTQWLKTMKRLPATAITSNTDVPGENRVASLAAHSLSKADVVTESMAEVWVKQGNTEKAKEVYNKLSLLYPAKSAYFAAKIESLKKPS